MEKPILFSGPMVRAILDGRKTMTRRVLKPQPAEYRPNVFDVTSPMQNEDGEWGQIKTDWSPWDLQSRGEPLADEWLPLRLPYAVGDVLYVRETWGDLTADHPLAENGRKPAPGDHLVYRANPADDAQWITGHPGCADFVWRPSIHMPRWASRISLKVTSVKVERLQDISEEDARAEGVAPACGEGCCWYGAKDKVLHFGPRDAFAHIWNDINAKNGWDANPRIVAIGFERIV